MSFLGLVFERFLGKVWLILLIFGGFLEFFKNLVIFDMCMSKSGAYKQTRFSKLFLGRR
jgi:hypothetical protein